VIRKVVNGHKSIAHTDSPDGGTGKTCLGGAMQAAAAVQVVMAALRSRRGHYILPCGFFLSSSFFPRLISAAAHWMSTILRHMMWP